MDLEQQFSFIGAQIVLISLFVSIYVFAVANILKDDGWLSARKKP